MIMVRKTMWGLAITVILAMLWVIFYRSDWLVIPPFEKVSSMQTVSKKATTKPTNVNPVKATTAKTTPVVTPVSVGTTTPKTGTNTASAGTPPAQTGTTATASGTDTNCAPNATSQDPCKLGQCFGYPYGVCESNPNQGTLDKDCASTSCTDPNANYYDLWGNEFTYDGTLIQASTEQTDPISGQVNPYYAN